MENRTETLRVRKIPPKNAFGGTDLRLWELYDIAADTKLSSVCRARSTQASASTDNRSQDEQEQTCNKALLWKMALLAEAAGHRDDRPNSILCRQDTQTIRQVTAASLGASLRHA